MIRNRFEKIRALQKQYCKISEKLDNEIKELENIIKISLQKNCKIIGTDFKIRFFSSILSLGSKTTDWNPVIYIHEIQDEKNNIDYSLIKDTWVLWDKKLSQYKEDKENIILQNMDKITVAMDKITKETTLPVKFANKNV